MVDTEDDIRRNTTFTVASMMSGTGILRPELAKIVVTALLVRLRQSSGHSPARLTGAGDAASATLRLREGVIIFLLS